MTRGHSLAGMNVASSAIMRPDALTSILANSEGASVSPKKSAITTRGRIGNRTWISGSRPVISVSV